MTPQLPGRAEGGTAAGARIDDHVTGIREDGYQGFEKADRFLRRVDSRDIFAVSLPLEPVFNHVPLAICIGVTIFIISNLFRKQQKAPAESAGK